MKARPTGPVHSRSLTGESGIHLDLGHHAAIFVVEDVAVIDKRTRNFGIAEIHADGHAGIGQRAVPVGDSTVSCITGVCSGTPLIAITRKWI